MRLALFALALLSLAACGRSPSVSPSGIYLAEGGTKYVKIDEGSSGTYKVVSDSMGMMNGYWSVAQEAERLVLEYKVDEDPVSHTPPMSLLNRYELVPSPTVPGDWDLVGCDARFGHGKLERDKPRSNHIPSFLHRVDHPDVVRFFHALEDLKSPASRKGAPTAPDYSQLLTAASELLAARGSDPCVQVLYLNALLLAGHTPQAREKLGAWRKGMEQAQDPFVRVACEKISCSLRGRDLSASGHNALDFMNDLLSRGTDLQSRLRRLPEVLRYEEYLEPADDILMQAPPSLPEQQVATKVFLVLAEQMMLEGKRGSAAGVLAASYASGQLLCGAQTQITRLVGVALSAIASGGLQTYAMNCCETLGEFDTLWGQLELLETRTQRARATECLALKAHQLVASELSDGNKTEVFVRQSSACARFELLRMSVAAKRRLVADGAFPKSASEFAPLLPGGPPTDPFTSRPLKWTADSASMTCYSAGPDGRDDRAQVAYDPTNGTVSAGDISVSIPVKRQYPFPREGVKAANADDLKRIFPDGLPRDPFADVRNAPLGITDTVPVMVYSFGPDTNQAEAKAKGSAYVPTIQYDPTNGMISAGDIYITIPPR